MGISDILVYVDQTASSAERLDIAFRLAHRFEAYLIGVVPEDAAAVGERLEKMLLNEAILGEWHMAIGLTEPFVTRWAHCADLVILGQRIPDHDTGLYRPEDVILSCSRPVLVVPYAGRRPDRLGENVLVAWNGSREAGRAVQEALPLNERIERGYRPARRSGGGCRYRPCRGLGRSSRAAWAARQNASHPA